MGPGEGKPPVKQPKPLPNDTDCPECFLTPCMAMRPNPNLGEGQGPCVENIEIRFSLYNGYWKMMRNAGGWMDPRYMDKKARAAGSMELAMEYKREIMPLCVVQKLQFLYPNPKGVPYVGHKF